MRLWWADTTYKAMMDAQALPVCYHIYGSCLPEHDELTAHHSSLFSPVV